MTKIFRVPFAVTGDKISPPDAVQADGSVSYSQGYGFDYQRETDGSDPLAKVFPREQHNGILNDITTAIGEIQSNGMAIWQVSGQPYPINAQVRFNDRNWKSTVANNSATPGSDSTWIDVSSQPVATEVTAGIVRIATQAMTDAGVDDSAAVTPLKLKQSIKTASESVPGVIRVATAEEASAGVSGSGAITPKTLKSAVIPAIGFTPVQQGGGVGQAQNNKLYLGFSPSAQRPSITVDATNYGGIAFLTDIASLPISKGFTSTQQAFTNGGLVSVAHGLGSVPKIISGELVCLVAENGWQVGDIQHISLTPDNDDAAVVTGFAARKDSTAIYARCGVSGPYGVNINTGGTAIPSAANWRLVLRAFV